MDRLSTFKITEGTGGYHLLPRSLELISVEKGGRESGRSIGWRIKKDNHTGCGRKKHLQSTKKESVALGIKGVSLINMPQASRGYRDSFWTISLDKA